MNQVASDMQPLKPMDIGDILDKSISLYRKNFWLFLGAAAVVHVPLFVVQSFLGFLAHPGKGGFGAARLASIVGSSLFLLLWFFTVMPLGQAAMTKIISEKYLGKEIDIAGAYKFVFGKFKVLFSAISLSGIFILLGMICLIIPGVLCIFWFLFVSQTILLEETTAFGALKRSKKLFQSSPGKTILMLIVLMLIGSVAQGMASLPVMALKYSNLPHDIKHFKPDSFNSMPMPPAVLLLSIIPILTALFLNPVSYAAMTLLYYDIRIRKEGFDLVMLAQNMGYVIEKKECPSCGKEVTGYSIFCGNCGVKLTGS